MGQMLASLHDVTPAHEERIFRAIEHLRGLGVNALNLLVVPDFHHKADLRRAEGFCQRLQSVLGPRDEMLLHGYFHVADTYARGLQRVVAGVRTAGEGEFHALPYAEAQRRISEGLNVLQVALNLRPRGFVPPAWLHHPPVLQALRDAGLDYTEDQTWIHDLRTNRRLRVPALTWASRDVVRRWGSRLNARVQVPARRSDKLVRLAVHPGDYDRPELMSSIARAATAWLPTHTPMTYAEVMG